MSFAIGDVVFLKSGGEKMTIEEIDGNDASCVWFNKDKKIDRGSFPQATLKKAATPEEVAAALGATADRFR